MEDRIVARYQRVELTAPYAAVWIDMRINPPMRVFRDFQSGDVDRIQRSLASMVQASNLKDEAGTPIDLSTEDGWLATPAELLKVVVEALTEAMSGPKATTPS